MNNPQFHTHVELSDSFEIIVVQEQSVEIDYKDQVEQIWQAQRERGSKLYNGKLLSLVGFNRQQLWGRFIDYKYYFAQQYNPQLKSLLNIKPIAISGITTSHDKLLMGRRSKQVTDHVGSFECVPSGGVDDRFLLDKRVDYHSLALSELAEEALITKEDIQAIELLGLVYDDEECFYELCLHFLAKEALLNATETEEYDQLEWWPIAEVATKMAQKNIVPLSEYLIHRYVKV